VDQRSTKLLLLAGTVFFSLIPLYLTSRDAAIFDGALLIIAVAFSADAIMRCLDPSNKKDNWTLISSLGSLAFLTVALLQYGPIANDLRRQDQAYRSVAEALRDPAFAKGNHSLGERELQPILDSEKERREDRGKLPNSSVLLLLCSVGIDAGVILLVES